MNNIQLSDKQIARIKDEAAQLRSGFGVFPAAPLGKNLRILIEKKGIVICEYPFKPVKDSHTDAALTLFKIGEDSLTFIGLNSSLYFDEQLFSLAHELYHYTTQTGMAYDYDKEKEDDDVECMADRFAAELLLPAEVVERMITMSFPTKELDNVSRPRLLRFIAKIQSEWMLPYQAIVKRFLEEGFIKKETFNKLYKADTRNENDVYYKILHGIDAENCELLNSRTKAHRVSGFVYDTILNNFEENAIGEDELVDILSILGKTPSDFGVEIKPVDSDDMDILFDGEE